MNNYGTFTESGTIRFERLLPGPIERVWAFLTESEKRGKWLASGNAELHVGGKVELNFNHKNLAPHDDSIPEKYKSMEGGVGFTGRVTKCDPPRLLGFTWPEENDVVSEVTFELIPKENNKVLLILTHRRLGDDRDTLISVASGWHTHLGILADRLSGKTPKGFWTVHKKVETQYEQRLAEK